MLTLTQFLAEIYYGRNIAGSIEKDFNNVPLDPSIADQAKRVSTGFRKVADGEYGLFQFAYNRQNGPGVNSNNNTFALHIAVKVKWYLTYTGEQKVDLRYLSLLSAI